MKTKERRHLKENELAHSVAAVRTFAEMRRKQIGTALVLVIALGVIVAGVLIIRQRSRSQGEALLADALVVLGAPVQEPTAPVAEEGKPAQPPTQQPGTFPTEVAKLEAALPKLKAAADGYPNSVSGITARYHLAGALADLGKHKEALAAYEDVIAKDDDGLYGRMAKLGKASTHAHVKEYEQAIAIYKELADAQESNLPADAVLVELARAYQAIGNDGEAQKTWSRIVHEHPASPFSGEAGKNIQQ